MRSKVDLPQPDGPTKTANSPSSIDSETSCTTSVGAEALADMLQFNARHRLTFYCAYRDP